MSYQTRSSSSDPVYECSLIATSATDPNCNIIATKGGCQKQTNTQTQGESESPAWPMRPQKVWSMAKLLSETTVAVEQNWTDRINMQLRATFDRATHIHRRPFLTFPWHFTPWVESKKGKCFSPWIKSKKAKVEMTFFLEERGSYTEC